MGQSEHHQVGHFKLWEHQKQNCDQSIFLICVQMGSIEDLQEAFIWTIISCAIFSTMIIQKRTEIAWMTIVKKLLTKVLVLKIQRNSTGNQWSCLTIRDAREYPLQFVTIILSVFENTAVCAC